MNKDQLSLFPCNEGKDFRKIPLVKKIYQSIEEFYNWFNENIDSLDRKELICITKDMQATIRELEKIDLKQQSKAGGLLTDRGSLLMVSDRIEHALKWCKEHKAKTKIKS